MGELRDRMTEDLRLRALAPSTQRTYVRCARKFAAFHRRSPAELGASEVRAFLLHLERKVSAATRHVYTAALKFLYRVTLRRPEVVAHLPAVKVPKRLPRILSGSEVERLLKAIHVLKYRAILMIAYASGLRIAEAVSLKPEDIDSRRLVIHVHEGKGRKDRLVPLSGRVLLLLRQYWLACRPDGPFLFPGMRPGTHLTARAVRKALKRATQDAGLTKRVYPHLMRHCFATHLLELGTDVTVVQQLLGHKELRTTLRYNHARASVAARTTSPLDKLGTPDGDILG